MTETPAPMKRRPLMLGLLPLLAACGSVLPDRPYVEVRRFPLGPDPVAPRPASPGAPVLLLRLMRAGPGLDQRGLRSLRPDGTEALDYYAEWSAPPPELVEAALRHWLEASGRFSAVVAPGSRARAGLILESELTLLQAELGPRRARVGLSGVLLREGEGEPRLLAPLRVEGSAALPAEPATPDAGTLAAAMGAALAEALRQLLDQIDAAMRRG